NSSKYSSAGQHTPAHLPNNTPRPPQRQLHSKALPSTPDIPGTNGMLDSVLQPFAPNSAGYRLYRCYKSAILWIITARGALQQVLCQARVDSPAVSPHPRNG